MDRWIYDGRDFRVRGPYRALSDGLNGGFILPYVNIYDKINIPNSIDFKASIKLKIQAH